MSHRPRKHLGQHFLRDQSILRRIIEAIEPLASDHVLEIGPGLGALTEGLIASGATCDVIEIDYACVTHLQKQWGDCRRLTIHSADALKVDLPSIARDKPLRVCGNLPYQISTPLLFHLLRWPELIQDMCFLLQWEVVARMSAMPDTAAYGRLSVMLQYHCAVTHLFDVPPQAFHPPPKVQSAVVRLKPYRSREHVANNEVLFTDIVREAFCHRRKTVGNACKNQVSIEQWQAAGIDAKRRPQTLSVAEWVAISNIVDDMTKAPLEK